MTISLEEPVARAIRDVVWDSPAIAVLGHDFKDREAYRTEFVASVARAAIAAVCPSSIRESERAACEALAQSVVDAGGNARGIVASIAARQGKGEGI